jgi:phosphatidate cytidylyltransferase
MMWMTGNAYHVGEFVLNQAGWKLMAAMLVVSLAAEWIPHKKLNLKNLLISIGGFLYISVSCGCMMDLRSEGIMPDGFFQMDLGLILPVLLIITMWINDTMAYIVGSLMGKTPLTSISPKKTWEGTVGGVVLAVSAITVFGHFFFKADVAQLLILSSIACIAGIFGDLLESKLKRKANIKDSGQILPGHGGFLDRFDSLLVATVFVWLYVKLFM